MDNGSDEKKVSIQTPPELHKTTAALSANNLLSADYNPNHNPEKDEIVQNASIRILEIESVLDKMNTHINKHHRKSLKSMQDFEQVKHSIASIIAKSQKQ